VLYEGRQIYFGHVHAAKRYFVNLGFECLPRQVTADFLTSVTSPSERRVRPGFEGKTPSTPDEFAAVWKASGDRAQLLEEIEEFDKRYPIGGASLDEFKSSRRAMQARSQYVQVLPSSPPRISILFTYSGVSNHPIPFQSFNRWHCVLDEGFRGYEEIWALSSLVLSSIQLWH
jgi:ATP-binding cassette, subfamily G (WHITE), member 2, PDR